MKKLFFLLFGTAAICSAQLDSKSKFTPIKPLLSAPKPSKPKENKVAIDFAKFNLPTIVAPNVFKETNIFGTKPKPNAYKPIGAANNDFSMAIVKKFEHQVGDLYREKMEKDLDKTLIRENLKEDLSTLDRNDRDLGEFRTKSNILVFSCRDFIYIDGDLINVYINGKLLVSRFELFFQNKQFEIQLRNGFNSVEIIVASTGSSGGNTGELRIVDGFENLLTHEYWNNLALGTKVKFLVIKE